MKNTHPDIVYRKTNQQDLNAVNQVIKQAVMAWPLSERLKRLSLNVLLYDVSDLQHFAGFVATIDTDIIGVTLWDPDHNNNLLHGLYVTPDYQAIGIGRKLIDLVSEQVALTGGDHLHIKAERISCSYFEQMGFTRVNTTDATQYPYLYRMDFC